jgi:Protein of unknown function (DUF2946)
MRRRRRPRKAAWLGLVALAIHAAIPLLLGLEISLASSPEWRGVIDPCLYGGTDDAVHHAEGTQDKPGHHDGDDNGLCPICLALHASPLFTTPAFVLPPVPAARFFATLAIEHRQAPRSLALLAGYRSRAPPIG